MLFHFFNKISCDWYYYWWYYSKKHLLKDYCYTAVIGTTAHTRMHARMHAHIHTHTHTHTQEISLWKVTRHGKTRPITTTFTANNTNYNYICRFWNKLHSYIKPSIVSLSTSNCSYSMGHQSLCKNYQTLAVKTEIYVIPTECISATCASRINKNVNRASSNRVFIM